MPPTEGNPRPLPNPDSTPGGVAGQHPALDIFPIFAATSVSGKEVNKIRMELIPVACWKLNDVRFLFGSSFLLPQTRGEFIELLQLRKQHPGAPLSVFGHTDPVSDDAFNKQLSGHRAESVYAVLVRDTAMWEKLFNTGGSAEGWGIGSTQRMLAALGFDPGPPTGSSNPSTTAAIRDFQTKNGLTVDGQAGPKTRAALFLAYMTFLCPDKFEKSEFLARGVDPKGKGDYQGCGEFNPTMRFSVSEEKEFGKAANKADRNEENGVNRRVMVLLFRPGTIVRPAKWPCPRTSEGVADCRKRFFSDGEARRTPQALRREFKDTKDTFACRFYHRLVVASPCEGIEPPPPVIDGVSPLIFFPEPEVTKSSVTTTNSALVDAPPTVRAAGIGPATRAVVVKKPHTTVARADIDLTTDVPFDGVGTFTVSPADRIRFFLGAKQITFNGTDNVFSGDELRVGVTLFAEGAAASANMNDVTLTLTLSGGSKPIGAPANVKMTAVEVTLDICEPRTSFFNDPPVLSQPPTATPAAKPQPKDKVFGGRGLPVQEDPKTNERAILFVRKIKPANFVGNLVLTALTDHVKAFPKEFPEAGEAALPKRHVFPSTLVQAADARFFAEGVTLSAKGRDTGFQLGIEGMQEDADRVSITVVHVEIVSDVEPKDLNLVARVPESPERKTKSKFFPAPIIVGVNYDVRLRPHTEMPAPDGVFDPLKHLWFTASPATTIELKDTAKQVVKLKAKKDSGFLNDVTIELIVDSEIGKFRKTHKLTAVTVVIDPVISGETPLLTSDINFIRNASVTPMLLGADAADTKKASVIDIKPITPNLTFTADDPRIAWWIIGNEPAEAGKAKYQGKADFLNSDAAKRGTRIQIAGTNDFPGDILVQPYSGGFGYGMFRTTVAPLRKVKYRVNRIFTDLVPATASKPLIPARVPTRSHADAKNHIKLMNIYLRQMGLELIPDDSVEVATTAGNPLIGLANLDSSIVTTTRIEAGHFDVKVNKQRFTFRTTDTQGDDSIRLNARNEVIVFAYIHSLASGNNVLAQAQVWPHNHAPRDRKDPPSATTLILKDSGVPSTSLITRTGIPGSTPVQAVNLRILSALFAKFKSSQTARHIDLLWGITVPTFSVDNSSNAANRDAFYATTLAHEVGHVLGLKHRISAGSGDPFADGLTTPARKNVMFPSLNFPTAENFDIIQSKAVRFSEVLFRNP